MAQVNGANESPAAAGADPASTPTGSGEGTGASSQSADLFQKLTILKTKNASQLTREEALQLAIEAAELNMSFLRLASSKSERSERREATNVLLEQAERIKKSKSWVPANDQNLIDLDPLEPIAGPVLPHASHVGTAPLEALPSGPSVPGRGLRVPRSCRQLPQDENDLLWRASNMRGGPFRPWSSEQMENLKNQHFQGSTLYQDKFVFRLSQEQLDLLEGWKRPAEALPPPFSYSQPGQSPTLPTGPTMHNDEPIDLVQDAATDCSVVASLCAGIARRQRGHDKLLSTLFFPFDEATHMPVVSATGKYIMRLNFNGCFRKVIIDDRLPVSKNSRLLHVVDRKNPGLLWPALLEKAYLKVRGGYDFPGSNSGTDLWILTGWIPEQLFLHDDGVDVDQLWERIRSGSSYGDLLITIGTGEITPNTEQALGLVGYHDYAVLDLKEEHGQRLMLIKNPWVNGTTWKGHPVVEKSDALSSSGDGSASSDTDEFQSAVDPQEAEDERASSNTDSRQQSLQPGTFWMPIGDVVQNFATLYLNWNPGLFRYQTDLHFSWDLGQHRSPFRSFRSNPQFSITCDSDDQIFLVLSKHFNERTTDTATQDQEYISLFAFNNHGNRVTLNRGATAQLPFIDSPQTTLRLNVERGLPVTLVAAEQCLAAAEHTFTLHAFASHRVSLERAKPVYADIVSADGKWTAEDSGGHANSVLYSKNPQFALHLPAASRVSVLLETLDETLSVHVKLLHGRGRRVVSVMKQDIVVDSGEHRKGCALAELRPGAPLDAGTYTIVCNTFEPGSVGRFKLHVESNVNASLNAIQREGAGRLQLRLAEACFNAGVRKVAAPVAPRRHCTVRFTIRASPSPSPSLSTSLSSSPVRLAVELGTGPERVILIASGGGAFREAAGDVYTEDFVMDAHVLANRPETLWLTLERMAGAQLAPQERFQITAWPDNGEWAQVGVWRDVDG